MRLQTLAAKKKFSSSRASYNSSHSVGEELLKVLMKAL
jgi:hypothetical protein